MKLDKPDQDIGQETGRELSTWVIMFHQAVADRFDLTATEHKCLDLLYRKGVLTAGQLANLTGLSTGAITKIADRLEKAGFVERERSQTDRRQVLLHPNPQRAQEMGEVFASLSQSMAIVALRYTEAERALIQDYLNQLIMVLKQETLKLQKGPAQPE